MAIVIGVRFKKVGKLYYFDPHGIEVEPGQDVIVETARGVEFGSCTLANTQVDDDTIVQPLRRMLRVATDADREVVEENERHARDAFEICKKKIVAHKLDMQLVTVECTFDLNKILFYFTADGRVDFRELVKDLASVFRTRIELRQIGVRDEAKMIGGLGICGRELCCTAYMDDFQPVSISMAKEQNLSLNPTKISGTCGRLMCCLKYEHDAYAELSKTTPKLGSLVQTPEGNGTVISTQMLRGTCKVQLDEGVESQKVFSCVDCQTLRSGRAKGGARPPCVERAGTQAALENNPPTENTADSAKPRRAPRTNTDRRSDEQRNDNPRPPRTPRRSSPQEERPGTSPAGNAPQNGAFDESRARRRRRGGRRRSSRVPEALDGGAPQASAPQQPPASPPSSD